MSRSRSLLIILAIALAAYGAGPGPALGAPGITTLISVSSSGGIGNSASGGPRVTPDARYVVFASFASNLVAGDLNVHTDVFVRDRTLGTNTRASVDSNEVEGNDESGSGDISDDGRYVVFVSSASNLVLGDTNAYADSFVRDLQAGTTARVSISTDGIQANGNSERPSISATGRFIVFGSGASNLVPEDTNGSADIFLRDRDTDADGIYDEQGAVSTKRVSVSSSGAQAVCPQFPFACNGLPTITPDGRYIAFSSRAPLVPEDSNSDLLPDVYIHDRQTQSTKLMSVDSAGNPGNGGSYLFGTTPDGRFVVFSSTDSALVPGQIGTQEIVLRDRDTDADGIFDEPGATATTVESVSTGGGDIEGPNFQASLSDDGRFVAFSSSDFGILLRDRQVGVTTLVSRSTNDVPANNKDSRDAAISSDGRFVAFGSLATNLVGGDTNGFSDVFLHDLGSAICSGKSATIVGTPGDDILNGTAGPDVIYGGDGNDTIHGLGGGDRICGGWGNDNIFGEEGNDILRGGDGTDILHGADGNDKLFGDGGSNTLNGGNGNDTLTGASGNDALNGDAGDDFLKGGGGDDAMDGGPQTDSCDGGPHVGGDTAVNCETITGVP